MLYWKIPASPVRYAHICNRHVLGHVWPCSPLQPPSACRPAAASRRTPAPAPPAALRCPPPPWPVPAVVKAMRSIYHSKGHSSQHARSVARVSPTTNACHRHGRRISESVLVAPSRTNPYHFRLSLTQSDGLCMHAPRHGLLQGGAHIMDPGASDDVKIRLQTCAIEVQRPWQSTSSADDSLAAAASAASRAVAAASQAAASSSRRPSSFFLNPALSMWNRRCRSSAACQYQWSQQRLRAI